MKLGRAWSAFWKKWLKTKMCRSGRNTVKVVVVGKVPPTKTRVKSDKA